MTDTITPSFVQTDMMDPARARALQAALGRSPKLKQGDCLPPFFHQLYFWDPQCPDDLGRDGHPKTGQGVIPDMGLPRRMWAGGRLAFHAPLLLGQEATCQTELLSATRKDGRSGPLGLVTLRLTYEQNNRTCVVEERDLIYREDPNPNRESNPAPQILDVPEAEIPLNFNSTMLFRYSALTFNGHRIHYDPAYAKDVEEYDGLVVHGPLLAQHLILLAQKDVGDLKTFQFRATAPLLHFEAAKACRAGQKYWIAGPNGRQCMIAHISV